MKSCNREHWRRWAGGVKGVARFRHDFSPIFASVSDLSDLSLLPDLSTTANITIAHTCNPAITSSSLATTKTSIPPLNVRRPLDRTDSRHTCPGALHSLPQAHHHTTHHLRAASRQHPPTKTTIPAARARAVTSGRLTVCERPYSFVHDERRERSCTGDEECAGQNLLLPRKTPITTNPPPISLAATTSRECSSSQQSELAAAPCPCLLHQILAGW